MNGLDPNPIQFVQQVDPVRVELLKRREALEKQIQTCRESIAKIDAVLVMFPESSFNQQINPNLFSAQLR